MTYVDAASSPQSAYEFATDWRWNRILFGNKDIYINTFQNEAHGGLAGPSGLDVDPQGNLFVADALNLRVLLLHFDPATRSVSYMGEAAYPSAFLGVPVDVAWDGRLGPLSGGDAYFYVVSSLSRVSYWHWNGVPNLDWQYGARGTGVGQFTQPKGVCVGHALGANGGTVFTADFYVADAGNNRLVWLRRNENNTVTWVLSVTLAQSGVPVDCTVDHFGNVYVADQQNSRILKYTANLGLLATYGTYGRGAANLNTLSHPHAIHVVYGRRTVNGQPQYFGDGRIITAEDWTDSSGALEHWLGVDLQAPYAPLGGGWGGSVAVWMTDHAYVTVTMLNDAGTAVATFAGDLRPSGWVSEDWNGLQDNGEPAAEGWYRFRITALSGYGCDGSAWCEKEVVTTSFFFPGRSSGGDCWLPPGDICPTEARMVSLLPGLGGAGGLPTTFFLNQLVSAYVGPLARRVDVAEDLRGLRGDPAQPGTLSAEVRARGLMALAVGVPAATTATPLTVRVYSLNGTLVRELVRESVDPGEYVIGWDGTDRDGRPVLPGVYIAVMSAGGFRGTQRLIVPRR